MTKNLRLYYIACALAVTVMFSLGNTTQGTLLTEFSSYYGIGAFTQSFISAAASLGMAAALFVLLARRSKITKNAMYVAAVGAVSISLGLIGTMPPFAAFLTLYALLGVAFGFIDAIGSSLIADVSAPESLTRNMGMLHAFYGIGGILGPLFIRFTANLADTRNSESSGTGGVALTAFILAGVAALLFIMNWTGFSMIKHSSPKTLKSPVPLQARELSSFFRAGSVPLLLTTALYGAYLNVVTFRMAQYITVDFGSASLGALSLSALWAGIVASRFITPRIKINLRVYITIGMTGTALMTLFGVLLCSAPAVIVTAFIAGLAGGAVIPMCISELCRLTPNNTLLASGSALLALYVVQLAGALLAGALTPNDNLGVGLLVAAVYALAGGIAAVMYKPAIKR